MAADTYREMGEIGNKYIALDPFTAKLYLQPISFSQPDPGRKAGAHRTEAQASCPCVELIFGVNRPRWHFSAALRQKVPRLESDHRGKVIVEI